MNPNRHLSNWLSMKTSSPWLAAALAIFVVVWQPLFVTDPLRASHELVFNTLLVVNFWSGSQGTLNALDTLVENWMNWNTEHYLPQASALDEPYVVELSNVTDFWRASRGKTRPVVIRGLFSDSRAVQSWNATTLSQNALVKDLPLQVFGGHCLERIQEAIARRQFAQNDDSSVCLEERTFGDFLQSPNGQYCKQFTHLFSVDPSLVADLELERLGSIYPTGGSAIVPTLFVGKGHQHPYQTPYHAAAPSNYFLQIVGQKQWRLAPPTLTPYMQPFFYSDVPSIASRIACVMPGAEQEYRYQDLPGTSVVTLKAGDFLYVPPWWFHEITHPVNDNWHIAVGLRPVDSVIQQHVPILSQHFGNTLGILPTTLKLAYNLYIRRLDFGHQYFEDKENNEQ